MIIESVLAAWLLSQPDLTLKELDHTYKPCVQLYEQYVELNKTNKVKAALFAENVRYLCTPIKYESANL